MHIFPSIFFVIHAECNFQHDYFVSCIYLESFFYLFSHWFWKKQKRDEWDLQRNSPMHSYVVTQLFDVSMHFSFFEKLFYCWVNQSFKWSSKWIEADVKPFKTFKQIEKRISKESQTVYCLLSFNLATKFECIYAEKYDHQSSWKITELFLKRTRGTAHKTRCMYVCAYGICVRSGIWNAFKVCPLCITDDHDDDDVIHLQHISDCWYMLDGIMKNDDLWTVLFGQDFIF